MTEEPIRSRLAIGVYDDRAVLCTTVAVLLRHGLALDQLGIISKRATIERALRPPDAPDAAWRQVASLLGETELLAGADGPCAVIASPGVARLVREGTWQMWTPRRSGVLQPDGLRPDVASHVRDGRTALTVVSTSSAQQRDSARILLAHSAYPVETHDIGVLR
jgi:hypothetical protein